jgi:hypothetical protein
MALPHYETDFGVSSAKGAGNIKIGFYKENISSKKGNLPHNGRFPFLDEMFSKMPDATN